MAFGLHYLSVFMLVSSATIDEFKFSISLWRLCHSVKRMAKYVGHVFGDLSAMPTFLLVKYCVGNATE